MLELGLNATTTTTGTGTITAVAVSGYLNILDLYGINDPVSYELESGNGDREWGIGTALTGNQMSRPAAVIAKQVGGVMSMGGSPINLSGTSKLIVTLHHGSPPLASPAVRTPVIAAHFNPANMAGNVGGSLTLTANRLYAMPILAPAYPALTGVGLVVTSAVAGTAYIGVAESYCVNGQFAPGNLLGQGSVNVGTTGVKTDTASYAPVLKPGHLYWWLLTCTSAAVIRGLAASNQSPILGLGSDGITSYTWLYAAQAGPIPADLTGVTWSMGTAGNTAPHLILTS